MSAKTAGLRAEDAHWEPKYPFDLVVAYEDKSTRDRAIILYDHLAQQLLDEYDFQCTWWKLEHLREPALHERATDAAADANMIILALRDGHELSPLARKWIEAWRARKSSSKSALVALVGEGDAAAREFGPVLGQLQKFAHAANMDFFSPTAGAAGPAAEISIERPREQAGTASPMLEQILKHKPAPPPWGINE